MKVTFKRSGHAANLYCTQDKAEGMEGEYYSAVDVARLVEAAKKSLHSMENLCDYKEDHRPEIENLKTALAAFKETKFRLEDENGPTGE